MLEKAREVAVLSGGGLKHGMAYGTSDEIGMRAADNPVHWHDLHATVLHLLGVDHERFSFKFQGLDQRLTGVEGAKVISELLG